MQRCLDRLPDIIYSCACVKVYPAGADMKIDILIFQVAILFLPGLLWARIDARYGFKGSQSDTEYFLRSFQFGLVSYSVTYLIYLAVGKSFTFVDFSEAGAKTIINGSIVYEILSAIAVGCVLSVIWLYATTYKWLSRFLQFIKSTKTYGDEDVWDFTFNSSSASVEYVHFRDFEKNLVYGGWVSSYSGTEKLRELVLRDVIVYDFNGAELYNTPMVYLARAPEDIHIEFPYKQEGS